jgi:hypothetical protein
VTLVQPDVKVPADDIRAAYNSFLVLFADTQTLDGVARRKAVEKGLKEIARFRELVDTLTEATKAHLAPSPVVPKTWQKLRK